MPVPSGTSVDPAAPIRWLRERRSTAWRAPLAAACLIAAAAHVPVTGAHLDEALYIGVLFVLLEIACTALAVALVRRPSRAVLLAIATVGALAVLALVLSRSVGLPLIGDDVGNWTEPLAAVSLVAELIMAAGGTAAALSRPGTTRRALAAGLVAGVLLLGAGVATTAAAASAEEDHHASDDDGHHGTSGADHDMDGMRMGLPAAAPGGGIG